MCTIYTFLLERLIQTYIHIQNDVYINAVQRLRRVTYTYIYTKWCADQRCSKPWTNNLIYKKTEWERDFSNYSDKTRNRVTTRNSNRIQLTVQQKHQIQQAYGLNFTEICSNYSNKTRNGSTSRKLNYHGILIEFNLQSQIQTSTWHLVPGCRGTWPPMSLLFIPRMAQQLTFKW